MPNSSSDPNIAIRPAHSADLEGIAAVHAKSFVRQSNSLEWVAATARSYPRARYFVAEHDARVVGYVVWVEKSGFRAEAVVELEQIAVLPEFRDRGVGRALIESLMDVDEALRTRNAHIKAVLITTRLDNEAWRLYQTALGAEIQATVIDLYSADEVIMVAKNPIEHLAKSHLAKK
jgi:ribosomal protein S18 acetylase RimI-like enzyme